MVFDLRREIAMNTHSDRELMLHLTQCVRKLALEVRDLRYAFLLASSRKDRKKGVKALSRLLSN
jgi:asparagine synthetase B (glutamine-hydrolysing)